MVSCKERDSEEDRVRAVIRKAVAAGNEKKVGEVVEDAVENFRGPRGASLQDCRRVLLGYFMQQGWIRAFEQDLKVSFVDTTHARVELDLVLARGNEVKKLEDVVPTNASRFLFTIELSLVSGEWKLTSADYAERAF